MYRPTINLDVLCQYLTPTTLAAIVNDCADAMATEEMVKDDKALLQAAHAAATAAGRANVGNEFLDLVAAAVGHRNGCEFCYGTKNRPTGEWECPYCHKQWR